MNKNIMISALVILFSSCGGFVDRLHRQMDAESGYPDAPNSKEDQFSIYRKQSDTDTPSVGSSLGSMTSTNNNKNLAPPIQREYLPESDVKRRYKASDLQDNSDSGSLWATPNNSSSLFANDERKATGDILLINVQSRLKDEIAMTLKKFFPPNEPGQKKEVDKAPVAANETAKDPAETEAANSDDKYHDKISSVIVEEIDREHVLLRGRKSLLFHNRKRLVEIQAMAARRDIKMDNSVDSDNILESSVQVLR